MQSMQQQEQDLAGTYSLRGQAALSGAGIDEHCGETVHSESR